MALVVRNRSSPLVWVVFAISVLVLLLAISMPTLLEAGLERPALSGELLEE